MEKLNFSSTVIIIGVNPNITLPKDILKALYQQAGKEKGVIQVKGKLNGTDFLANIVKYQGEYRLYLNGIMRKAARIDVGDIANVEIEFDPQPRIEKMPPRFAQALTENIEAKAVFEKFPPSHKKEVLRYLNSMKTEESLIRNIENVIQHLLGKKPNTLSALMRTKVLKS